MEELHSDIVIVGGGLGAVSATRSAAMLGRRVLLISEDAWLGGQLTAQAVPPDEHPWVDKGFASAGYRELRERIREYYRTHYPLTDDARADRNLNPGAGNVSPLCHEPRVAAEVIDEMLAEWTERGLVTILREYVPTSVERTRDTISAIIVTSREGTRVTVRGHMYLDATELGDLLDLGSIPHVIGAESRSTTGELHALDVANPRDQQSFSWCAAVEYRAGETHTIEPPDSYERWRNVHDPRWPGQRFSWTDTHPITLDDRFRSIFTGSPEHAVLSDDRDLWHFRRILAKRHLDSSYGGGDISLINWPQIDYCDLPLVGASPEEHARALRESREFTLSFLYWMQTEAPRNDGGSGYPELRLRGDVLGTSDGLARAPYIRESRRLKALFTVTEAHIGCTMRGLNAGAAQFEDSVGIGHYRIDLHPSAAGRNYVDITCFPFQIPLGALIPETTSNLIAANKNIGTTHITNGAYRLHPVEWSIGEAAGAIAAYSITGETTPAQVRNSRSELQRFQELLVEKLGIPLEWPHDIRHRGVPDQPVERPERQWLSNNLEKGLP